MAIVVQISDTLLRAAPHTLVDKDPDESLSATVAAVCAVHADLVVLTGDLADDGSIAALSRVRDLVGRLAAPCVAVAGNHDDRAHVPAVFGSTDTVDLGSWRVLTVESVIPGKDEPSSMGPSLYLNSVSRPHGIPVPRRIREKAGVGIPVSSDLDTGGNVFRSRPCQPIVTAAHDKD